ncbi:hypothetical protein HAX54_033425 [Datura stramonium]|uniref:RNase H type-1 domain-containing protein n=1 Tax=Datura stramonium TaxID=4076 RepID=A0ABS8VCB7_DATST|nr:hypothetical protein [Datura stramonium]
MWILQQKLKIMGIKLTEWSKHKVGNVYKQVKKWKIEVQNAEEQDLPLQTNLSRANMNRCQAEYTAWMGMQDYLLRQKSNIKWALDLNALECIPRILEEKDNENLTNIPMEEEIHEAVFNVWLKPVLRLQPVYRLKPEKGKIKINTDASFNKTAKKDFIVKMDPLVVHNWIRKMVLHNKKLRKDIEDIATLMEKANVSIMFNYREGNRVTDQLAKFATEIDSGMIYNHLSQMPKNARVPFSMDK